MVARREKNYIVTVSYAVSVDFCPYVGYTYKNIFVKYSYSLDRVVSIVCAQTVHISEVDRWLQYQLSFRVVSIGIKSFDPMIISVNAF